MNREANPDIPEPSVPCRLSVLSSIEQQHVGKWPRGELEDRYFRLYDESVILKKHGRKQEDKIKRLSTKLLRLISDRKKLEQVHYKVGNARKRDIETEQLIEEMQDKIRELERNNKLVHEKLIVSRQQLAMQLKKPVPTAYRHISSRLDTGIPKQVAKMPGCQLHGSGRESRSPHARYTQSPLDENVKIKANIDENDCSLRRQINLYEQELQSLKETLRVREIEHGEELVAVKSQLTQDQRQLLQENISVIRLQRELKQRASQLMALEAHCTELDKNLNASRKSHEQVLSELDSLGQELKNAQQQNLTLQEDMRVLVSNGLVIAELKEKNSDLENENKILKESNNVLISSALNSVNKENSSGLVNRSSWESQIAKLEAALNYAKDDKSSMIKAINERDKELQELRSLYSQLEVNYNDLRNKFKLFDKDNELNFGELEEALSVISQRKENAIQSQISPDAMEQDSLDVLKQQLLKTHADHVETINELEKTRNLLVAQHRINQDYQQEVDKLSKKLANAQKEYERLISDQANLLAQQAASIQQLERQLISINSNSNHHKLNSETNEFQGEVDADLHGLSPGENVFEIHVYGVEFVKDICDKLPPANVSTFVSWNFYTFEVQATPSVQGFAPKFDFISQYAVSLDEAFLKFIDQKKVTFKLHQIIGSRNEAVAVGDLDLNEMLLKPEDFLRKKVPLFGIGEEKLRTSFGFLDISLNLKVPQAILKNSSPKKFLSVVEDNTNSKNECSAVNDLHINIVRCGNIQSRTGEVCPSAYCVYKFNSNPDHATAIVQCNSNPEFGDHMIYHCKMDSHLDNYLKTQDMQIYVFDDNDQQLSAYLGMASIPLLQLTQNQAFNGNFDLTMAHGKLNGNIEISICWQFAYNLSWNTTNETQVDVKIPGKNVKQIAMLPPKPMPRTLTASQHLNDTFEKTDKKPPLFPREPREPTMQRHTKPTPSSIGFRSASDSHQHIIENSSVLSSSSISESNSDSESSESDAVVIASGSSKRHVLDMDIQSSKVNVNAEETVVGSSMKFDDDSDSEIVVSADTGALESSVQTNHSIVIIISYLTLMEHAAVLKDDKVQMLFVEYRFLDFPPEELETPFALPKPKPNQKIAYNFRKVFDLNPEKNIQRRQHLAKVMSSPSKSRLKFTIVSEPLEDNLNIDCEDIGYSYVDLNKILRNRMDITEEDIGGRFPNIIHGERPAMHLCSDEVNASGHLPLV